MKEETRRVLHSSEKDDWGTPDWIFEKLHKQYNFTLDLCASADNSLLPRWCDSIGHGNWVYNRDHDREDGPIDWDKEIFFCNPPYGKKLYNILDAIPSSAKGIFLLPSRTGSRWFHEMMNRGSWMIFLKGRLKFKGAVNSAPFDSVLLAFNLEFNYVVEGKYFNLYQRREV